MIEAPAQLSGLYLAILWACAAGAALVFAVMLYSIAAFRREPGHDTRGTTAEVLWAVVPIAIVIAMAAPAVRDLVSVPGEPGMAHQPASQAGPELAREIPEKPFNEGVVPL